MTSVRVSSWERGFTVKYVRTLTSVKDATSSDIFQLGKFPSHKITIHLGSLCIVLYLVNL